jgi:hypothetical protein
MEAALVGGMMQVTLTILNHILGKKKMEHLVEQNTQETAVRQLELQEKLLIAKQKCAALELELSHIMLKMQKEEQDAKQRKLKSTVEQFQLQIRRQRLDRQERLNAWFAYISDLNFVALFSMGVFSYAAVCFLMTSWCFFFGVTPMVQV